MRIISHRGYWGHPDEKNAPLAFERSFRMGFGTETDIRDHQGILVISHDVPTNPTCTLDQFLKIYVRNNPGPHMPLALNIKSDGLQDLLKPMLKAHGVEQAVVFDMSIPEQVVFARKGIPFLSRMSEHEPVPAMLDVAQGVWLDGFESVWFDEEVVSGLVGQRKDVFIVSPELHRREPGPFWEAMRNWESASSPRVVLCTDLPEDAKRVFHGL